MTLNLALKTLNAIDTALEADQGSAFRGFLQKVLPHMADAYRQGREDFRSHLGASGIGKECGRAIWYSFRWHTPNVNSAKMVRLFNRGHTEEARFISLLLQAGIQVVQQDENGKQFAISDCQGHFGGSGDGLGIGVPDIPDITMPVLLEFKTHGEKSFIKLAGKNWAKYVAYMRGQAPKQEVFEGEGVYNAKFEHYAQCQSYMFKMGVPYALYMAVNKNTDEIYAEIIVLDPDFAGRFVARAETIIWMKQPPKKLSTSPGFFACKFCDHFGVCHLAEKPAQNCRTCYNSSPGPDKTWVCSKHNATLSKEQQLQPWPCWSPILENVNDTKAA